MKVVLFANTGWYLFNFRRSLAAELARRGHEVLLVSPADRYGDELSALGFRWIAAPMSRRSLNPFRELMLLVWLAALFRRERIDLVHGFTIKPAVYGALAARMASVPARVSSIVGLGYVFTSSDLTARCLRPVIRSLFRIALGAGKARVILQNPDDVSLFERARLVDTSSVRLIHGSGVDCTRFKPSACRPRGERFRVLLATRLLWDKGVAEFVAAAKAARAERRGIEFLLAGTPDPGNPRAVPDAAIRGWVQEGILQWLGHVDDMPALLRSVDAVVLPSYREGLPKSLIEAAASALPLITTDAPGCREVVEHDVTGLRVPVRDGTALARAVALLHDDPAMCSRLGAAARERALNDFDERIVLRKTLAVYGELLDIEACPGPTNDPKGDAHAHLGGAAMRTF